MTLLRYGDKVVFQACIRQFFNCLLFNSATWSQKYFWSIITTAEYDEFNASFCGAVEKTTYFCASDIFHISVKSFPLQWPCLLTGDVNERALGLQTDVIDF